MKSNSHVRLLTVGVSCVVAVGLVGAWIFTPAITFAQQRGPNAQAPFRDTFPVDKANLTNRGTNKYFVLEPGYKLTLTHGGATLIVSVLNETKLVDGVETRIIEERETDEKGALAEISRNFLAIDKQTSDVYYFGEEVDIYKDGKIDSHEGAWLSGVNGAHFGLFMPGTPEPGQKFYQEIAPKVAMDRCEITSITGSVKTPAGAYTGCVMTDETSGIETGTGHKAYAPNVGLAKDDEFLLAKVEKP